MILLQTVAKWWCNKLCALFAGLLCTYHLTASWNYGWTSCKLDVWPSQHIQGSCVQGCNHDWKVGGPRFGSQHWALAPRTWPKAGVGVGCGKGSPPPAVRDRGYHSQKIFENSDAKSCILVTTCCEISCFLKTTAKKLGDQYIVSPPT